MGLDSGRGADHSGPSGPVIAEPRPATTDPSSPCPTSRSVAHQVLVLQRWAGGGAPRRRGRRTREAGSSRRDDARASPRTIDRRGSPSGFHVARSRPATPASPLTPLELGRGRQDPDHTAEASSHRHLREAAQGSGGVRNGTPRRTNRTMGSRQVVAFSSCVLMYGRPGIPGNATIRNSGDPVRGNGDLRDLDRPRGSLSSRCEMGLRLRNATVPTQGTQAQRPCMTSMQAAESPRDLVLR